MIEKSFSHGELNFSCELVTDDIETYWQIHQIISNDVIPCGQAKYSEGHEPSTVELKKAFLCIRENQRVKKVLLNKIKSLLS